MATEQSPVTLEDALVDLRQYLLEELNPETSHDLLSASRQTPVQPGVFAARTPANGVWEGNQPKIPSLGFRFSCIRVFVLGTPSLLIWESQCFFGPFGRPLEALERMRSPFRGLGQRFVQKL